MPIYFVRVLLKIIAITESEIVALIPEHKEDKINLDEDFISYEKSASDSYYECKVYDISSGGIYIECDYPFDLNDKADLNAYKFVNHAGSDYFSFPDAEIKWKKDLQDSEFMFGYGLEFTEPFQSIKAFITNAKEKRPFIFLFEILEIIGFIGFTVFLAYCTSRIFFDLKPVGEPFDLFILGCGLISFPHILRIIAKNSKYDRKMTKLKIPSLSIFR
jgi:hypothetical protein